jgi:uncharacterized protein DUF6494
MNEEALNMSVRKFLKQVGVTSQHEIEMAIRAADAAGKLKGRRSVAATMTLSVPDIGLYHEIKAAIDFE